MTNPNWIHLYHATPASFFVVIGWEQSHCESLIDLWALWEPSKCPNTHAIDWAMCEFDWLAKAQVPKENPSHCNPLSM
jgi:hypothetical protein